MAKTSAVGSNKWCSDLQGELISESKIKEKQCDCEKVVIHVLVNMCLVI